jgi:hypothetical protein
MAIYPLQCVAINNYKPCYVLDVLIHFLELKPPICSVLGKNACFILIITSIHPHFSLLKISNYMIASLHCIYIIFWKPFLQPHDWLVTTKLTNSIHEHF